MSLETSKKVLKVFGIIDIIFGILGILAGIAAVAGGSLLGAAKISEGVAANQSLAIGVGLLGIGGLAVLISSVLSIVEGYFSIKASKDSSKIMPAWVFALIGIILSIVGAISTFTSQTATKDVSTIVGIVIGVLIHLLIFVAANNIKKSAGK